VPLRLYPAQGNPIEIEADRTLIGRDRTAEVRLTESSVSRKHATIEHRGSEWFITDGGSANGTFLDGVQVGEGVLRNGQTLRLGAATFTVEIETVPATQTLPPIDRDAKTQPAIQYRPPVVPLPARMPAPVPVRVPAPSTAPPPPAAPPAPVAQGMTAAQAAEILGVVAGASAADVRRQYQRLHNDLQIRITNTPSPSLKRMYQKNLQELKAACEVLAPGASS
jgi:pSer/pThr/pTyr-binding forkhead associated (FHA) protein